MFLCKKKSKYRAVPTVIDNMRFPSKLEAGYYQTLKIRMLAHDLLYFLRQVPIHLPGGIKYVVDFVLFENDGRVRYVDLKGFETATFKLKKKQVEALYPITIEIVKK